MVKEFQLGTKWNKKVENTIMPENENPNTKKTPARFPDNSFSHKIMNAFLEALKDENVISGFRMAFESKRRRFWLKESEINGLSYAVYDALMNYDKRLRFTNREDWYRYRFRGIDFLDKLITSFNDFVNHENYVNEFRNVLKLNNYEVDKLSVKELTEILTIAFRYYATRKEEGISIDPVW